MNTVYDAKPINIQNDAKVFVEPQKENQVYLKADSSTEQTFSHHEATRSKSDDQDEMIDSDEIYVSYQLHADGRKREAKRHKCRQAVPQEEF